MFAFSLTLRARCSPLLVGRLCSRDGNHTTLTIDLNGASFSNQLAFSRECVAVFVVAEKRIGGDDATALAVALKRSTSVTSVHLQCQAPFCSSWFRRVFIGARRVRWSVAGKRDRRRRRRGVGRRVEEQQVGGLNLSAP